MESDQLIEKLRYAGARIGDNVFFGPDVYIEVEFAPLLTIESGVVLARGVSIILHDSGLNNVVGAPLRFGRIVLREDCYIGVNATILCGVEIGARALIGAASLVNRSVPADHVAFGSPARVQGTVAEFVARQATKLTQSTELLALPPWRERRSPADNAAAQARIETFVRELAAAQPNSSEPMSMEPFIEHSKDQSLATPPTQKNEEETPTDGTNEGDRQLFFSLPGEEQSVIEILEKIDRNLTLRPLLAGASETGGDGLGDALAPSLPNVQEINKHLDELQRLHSLVYLVDGGSAGQLVKRSINPLIKIVSKKQILFNRELIELLSRLATMAPASQRIVDTINLLGKANQQNEKEIAQVSASTDELAVAIREEIGALRSELDGLRSLQGAVGAGIADHRTWLEKLTADKSNHDHWLQQLTQDKETHDRWLHRLTELTTTIRENQGVATSAVHESLEVKRLASEIHGLSLWMTALNDRVTDIAKHERDREDHGKSKALAPVVVDPAAYKSKVEAANGDLRVNLGAGDKPWAGYINVDARDLPGVDVVADIARLPYGPSELAELASSHVVEHFREHYLRNVLLPYWRELLRSGGLLRVICPDWEAMLGHLQAGTMSFDTFKLLTFGGQDYVGNDHLAMYSPSSLASVLTDAGFVNIQIVATNRMNHICPEMELTAERP